MASIERTAYPRFKRTVTARELHESFTPSLGEIDWARELTRSPEHLLALVVLLKAFQRLGYFPDLYEVPIAVVEHVRGYLDMASAVEAVHDSDRTAERHRAWIRERVGVVRDMKQARKLAEQAIYDAVQTKDNPADLINVALEELVRAGLELPGYSTLDEMAAKIREEVNAGFHATIHGRISDTERGLLVGLLTVNESSRRSRFDDLKRPSGAATLSRFKEHLARLAWMDVLGSTDSWIKDVPAAKVAHFAAEAKELDAADMRKLGEQKKVVFLACLLHVAKTRGRDELATMYCKRLARVHKQARDRFEALREASRVEAERLVDVFGDVLAAVRESIEAPEPVEEQDEDAGESAGDNTGQPEADAEGEEDSEKKAREQARTLAERAGRAVLATLDEAGGIADLLASHEQVSAYHGDNYLPFMEKFYRRNRATLFELLNTLVLVPTTNERTVFGAVEFLHGMRQRTGEYIPDHHDGQEVDLSFASEAWLKIIRDRRRPSKLVRRHFEACVFSYLAAELRAGDIAVAGSESYANLQDQLLTWEECRPLVAEYCAEVGLPDDAPGFTSELRRRLTETAAGANAGFPANTDLDIVDGEPVLKRRKGKQRSDSAKSLEKLLLSRLPERPILDVLTRTTYRTECFRHFGPVSGSDPKIRDTISRYTMLTFCYGANLGPYQTSRHMGGQVSAQQLITALGHAGPERIEAAKRDVVNAFLKLDLPEIWGDGKTAVADGSQIDTWADNLLAESHIRYGGYGGIAYRHIANSYTALFSRFIPCGRGRPSTSSKACWPTSPTYSPTPCTPTRRGSRCLSSDWRTCAGSSCCPASATGRTTTCTGRAGTPPTSTSTRCSANPART